jgi:chromatin segregation and condensation protein Rec8/ScpA/Scc1 (kleisin family)
MLLPKTEENEEDPRMSLTDSLLRFQQAKEAVVKLGPLYAYYSARMVKDTDEISVDKTFVADQSVTSLCQAVRRIIAYREEHPQADKVTFTPMIAKPIVPVEAKIVGILRHFERKEKVTMTSLIEDAVSLPDMIAVFLGILELVKLRRIVLVERDDISDSVYGIDSEFIIGEEPAVPEDSELISDFDILPDSKSEEVNTHAD